MNFDKKEYQEFMKELNEAAHDKRCCIVYFDRGKGDDDDTYGSLYQGNTLDMLHCVATIACDICGKTGVPVEMFAKALLVSARMARV